MLRRVSHGVSCRRKRLLKFKGGQIPCHDLDSKSPLPQSPRVHPFENTNALRAVFGPGGIRSLKIDRFEDASKLVPLLVPRARDDDVLLCTFYDGNQFLLFAFGNLVVIQDTTEIAQHRLPLPLCYI